MRRIIAIADDLFGAAETAAAFLAQRPVLTYGLAQSAQVALGVRALNDDGAPRVCLLPQRGEDLASAVPDFAAGAAALVLDTDNRRFPAEEAADRLRRTLDGLPAGDSPPEYSAIVFLKIDSLLRGPLASQLGVLAAHGPVILAPALPPLGRTTVNGTVHHCGVPMHETSLWHAETATDRDAIASAALSIADVRFAGASALGAALARTSGRPPRDSADVVHSSPLASGPQNGATRNVSPGHGGWPPLTALPLSPWMPPQWIPRTRPGWPRRSQRRLLPSPGTGR